MTKKKEEKKHSKHYYDKGRNGWIPTSTLDVSSKSEGKEDLKEYVNELERYVKEMEEYIFSDTCKTEEYMFGKTCKTLNEQEPKVTVANGVDFCSKVDIVVKEITDLLKQKNIDYGNTGLNPPKIFSKLEATEALCARIDDKLSRIKNKGINDKTEDTVSDLIGYLILLKLSI
tara:strand:+ start:9 stop:527 length:519 start_codon:yes stop_codon:yes gene_type:complete